MKEFNTIIDTNIDKFIDDIVKVRPELDKDELLKLWYSVKDEKGPVCEVKPTHTEGYCFYVFQRGKNKGSKCGAKSRKGGILCYRHKKHESKCKNGEVDKRPQVAKLSVSLTPRSTSTNSSTISQPVTLRMNKNIKRPIHKLTNLVFESKSNLSVIGKLGDADIILKLTDNDVEQCKKYGFRVKGKSIDTTLRNENIGHNFSMSLLDNTVILKEWYDGKPEKCKKIKYETIDESKEIFTSKLSKLLKKGYKRV